MVAKQNNRFELAGFSLPSAGESRIITEEEYQRKIKRENTK